MQQVGTADRSVVLDGASPLSAEFARSVLMGMPAITYVYDATAGKSLFQNRSLRDLLGHKPVATDGSSWVELMHPDDKVAFPAYRERLRAMSTGDVVSWEYRLRTPSGDWRWFQSRDVLLSESGGSKLIVGNAADITAQKDAQAQRDLLLGEMKHRSKNFGAIIRAIATQSGPKTKESAEPFERFVARLIAQLDTGDLLLASENRSASVRAVLDTALKPFVARSDSIVLSGPALELPERTAGNLGLIVHELATNAVKYGALASADGTLDIAWKEKAGFFHLSWREGSTHTVQPPSAEGFGTRLLRGIAASGSLRLDFAPTGLCCEFDLPLA